MRSSLVFALCGLSLLGLYGGEWQRHLRIGQRRRRHGHVRNQHLHRRWQRYGPGRRWPDSAKQCADNLARAADGSTPAGIDYAPPTNLDPAGHHDLSHDRSCNLGFMPVTGR